MIIHPETSYDAILKEVRRFELIFRARNSRLPATGVAQIMKCSRYARSLAQSIGKRVYVWNREAMPDEYRWRGKVYTEWHLVASSDGTVDMELNRRIMPTNSNSFVGVECTVEGLSSRRILWSAGMQQQRVLRFEPHIIRAIQRCCV